MFGYFVFFFTAFCLLLILLCLSVPVQVTDWKDSEMTYNVLMGTLNPTHSLTHSGLHQHCAAHLQAGRRKAA